MTLPKYETTIMPQHHAHSSTIYVIQRVDQERRRERFFLRGEQVLKDFLRKRTE
jgi:hypothetical protein